MSTGIYKIKNLITDKVYIGSATDIEQRWREHRYKLRHNFHANSYFQNAWNKYGEEDFKFEIIEICGLSNISEKEQYWMDLYCCYDKEYGYNILKLARTTLGYKHTKQALVKISAANKNKKKPKLRNFEKWPHPDGWKCSCNECYEKKRIYYKSYDEVRYNV